MSERLAVLAGHAWGWRDGRPLHLAVCPCWGNGGAPSPALAMAIRRPPSSLWARLFGDDR